MTRFRFSYNGIVYMGEDLRVSADRLVRFGYDAIELVGERNWYPDTSTIRSTLGDVGLAVSSICALWNQERDLSSPDPKVRANGVDYGREMADFAAEVGAPIILIAPSAWAKLEPLAPPEVERGWAIENIRRIAEYAANVGVNFTLEPWNRFETYFMNRLEQAVDLLKETGLANGGVHGDTFHMNIDENMSIGDAYRRAGTALNHTHIDDSNRGAPGTGHIDFRDILRALDEVDYKGYLCFELLPPKPDFWPNLRAGMYPEFRDELTERSIKYMKALEAELFTPTSG
jgi:sugar phosphate isomerase/epimerase